MTSIPWVQEPEGLPREGREEVCQDCWLIFFPAPDGDCGNCFDNTVKEQHADGPSSTESVLQGQP